MGRSYIRNVGTGSIYNESGEIMAGQIVFCAGNSIPNGYLECNGATVSRTTYATLFAAIGSTYGPGDGATTFALPDLRGEFLRGADRGRGVDSGRAVGSAQNATRHPYLHKNDTPLTLGPKGYVAEEIDSIGPVVQRVYESSTNVIEGQIYQHYTSRPRNVAMIAAIKYS